LLGTLAHYIRAHYAFENYSNMLQHARSSNCMSFSIPEPKLPQEPLASNILIHGARVYKLG